MVAPFIGLQLSENLWGSSGGSYGCPLLRSDILVVAAPIYGDLWVGIYGCPLLLYCFIAFIAFIAFFQ